MHEHRARMNGVQRYLSDLWRFRQFWIALAKVDLRNRFRRSRVGVLWVAIHPFMFTIILGIMFKFVFRQPFIPLSLYIFSGMVLWNWITESATQGSAALIQSQAFIRQKRLPLLGYAFRTFSVTFTTFLLAFSAMFAWFLITGHAPGPWVLLLPIHFVLLGFVLFPVTAFSSILGTMHRDYQQAVMVLLQALWFISPVFMDKKLFLNPGLREWDAINPVSAMLSLIRRPLLENRPPALEDYLVIMVFALIAWAMALYLFRRHERRIVYYL